MIVISFKRAGGGCEPVTETVVPLSEQMVMSHKGGDLYST